MVHLFAHGLLLGIRVGRYILMVVLRYAFAKVGRNFVFDPFGLYSYDNIEVGDDVFIGPGAKFRHSNGKLIIGSRVMFGPNVLILGGDHTFRQVGRFIMDEDTKGSLSDGLITIGDDVWVGANVTILKKVVLSRGCVIGAGSVVTKSIPPYAVAVGNPAKVVKFRFSPDEVVYHEEKLYSEGKRINREKLMNNVDVFNSHSGSYFISS